MAGGFIYYFDIASILICTVMMLFFVQQHFIKNKLYYSFIMLNAANIITCIFDILSVVYLDNHNAIGFETTNIIYYIGQQFTAYFFFFYVTSPLEYKLSISWIKKVMLVIPIAGITILCASNPLTHVMYAYNYATNTYSYGPLQFLCYVVAALYYFWALKYVVANRRIFNKHLKYGVYNTYIVILISIVLQLVKPDLLVHGIAIAISIMQLTFIYTRQSPSFVPETGYYELSACIEMTQSLLYSKIPFSTYFVRVADYEVILSTYGPDVLNKLMIEVANKLSPLFTSNNKYTMENNTFAFISRDMSNNDEMLREMSKILDEKYVINDLDIKFSYFLTCVNYPEHYTTTSEMFSYAMYFARNRKLRYGILSFDELNIRDFKREKDVEAAIRRAIKNKSFTVNYQPIVSCKDEKYVSAEALVRLTDEEMGFIGPAEFIPIAEKDGQIIDVDNLVIETVCKFIEDHDMEALGLKYIELNLSTVECLQRDFIPRLNSIIKKYHVDPKYLCFEITETAANCSPELFTQNLQYLHDAGFKLAVDDFGTGYGNLQRLMTIDFDIVKFDRSTVQQFFSDERASIPVGKLVSAIHSLGCVIVAEGVETEEQKEFIVGQGFDYIQGYYYSRPIPNDEYLKLLEKQK